MITLRKATPTDAEFLSTIVIMALGEDYASCLNNAQQMQSTVSVCRQEDTLYSWRNAWIAERDGELAGAIIGYDGERYSQMRQATFSRLQDVISEDVMQMQEETQAGEFYLDSLAVLPPFRGQGIGKQLLLHAIKELTAEKNQAVTLVVLPDNPARKLYESIGFHPEKEMFLFGEHYLRCRYLPV